MAIRLLVHLLQPVHVQVCLIWGLLSLFLWRVHLVSQNRKKYPFCSSCSKSTLIMAFAHGNLFLSHFPLIILHIYSPNFIFLNFLAYKIHCDSLHFIFSFRSNIYDFKIPLQISYSSPLHHQFSIICRNIFPSLPYLSLKEFLHNNWEKSRNFKISFSYFYLFLSLNFFPSILASCDGSGRGIKHSKWILNVMKKKSKIKSPWMDKIM